MVILTQWFNALDIPFGFNNYNISHLEMLNIVVAAKL